jgi:hypothetical protein
MSREGMTMMRDTMCKTMEGTHKHSRQREESKRSTIFGKRTLNLTWAKRVASLMLVG